MNARQGRSAGLLFLAFPAMLLLGALDVVLTGRDLTELYETLQKVAEPVRHPIVAWVQRGISLLLLIASVEQIANHFSLQRRTPSYLLLAGFVLYWLGTVGMTAVFAANPLISHEYLYSLALGVAVCLVGTQERARIVHAARDTLFLLMLAGVLMIPLNTTMVMDVSYSQGLLPGVPRFGGLTAHPVTQGMLAQIALLVLWCNPYQRRWLNRAAWALGLGVLFIAQSKTAWTAFMVCALVLLLVRNGAAFWQRMSDPRGGGGFGVVICLAAMVGVLGLAGWVIVGDAMGQVQDFTASAEGAQLMSLTGRDRIWVAAWEEWERNPVFGYGLSIWDPVYRASINMPNATHAHNQFMDDLARSGTVGAIALVFYATVLLVLSIRTARASGGLSLALFVAIALRSVSEVPLTLMGYGTELFTHLLLLATVAAACAQRKTEPRRAPSPRFGVPA